MENPVLPDESDNLEYKRAFDEILNSVQECCRDCPTALACVGFGAKTVVEECVSVEQVAEVIAGDIEEACEKGWQVYTGPDPEIAGVCHYGGDRRPYFKA